MTKSRSFWILVLAVLVLGGALRLYGLGEKSLWGDEYITIARMGRRPGELLSQLRSGNQTPLYYLIEHGALRRPANPFGVRLPSALFGILTLPAFFVLSRRLAGARAAFLAVLLLALNTFHLSHSQDARPYALHLLLTVLSYLYLMKALEAGKARDWGFFILFTVLNLYTTYLSVLVVSASGFLALVFVVRPSLAGPSAGRSTNLRRAVFSFALIALLFLPWVSPFVQLVVQERNPQTPAVKGSLDPAQKGRAPILALAYRLGSLDEPTMVVLSSLFFAGLFFALRRDGRLFCFLFVTLLPQAAFLLLTPFRHFMEPRYSMAALPSVLLAAAAAVDAGIGKLERVARVRAEQAFSPILLAGVFGFLLLSVKPVREYFATDRADWKTIATLLNQSAKPNDAVVYDPIWDIPRFLSYYLDPGKKWNLVPMRDVAGLSGTTGAIRVVTLSPLPPDAGCVLTFGDRAYLYRVVRPSQLPAGVEQYLLEASAEAAFDLWRTECSFELAAFYRSGKEEEKSESAFRRAWLSSRYPVLELISRRSRALVPVQPVSLADRDGDRKADPVVYAPGEGQWLIHGSETSDRIVFSPDPPGVPFSGDFDGDGLMDLVLYHPDLSAWSVLTASGRSGTEVWGEPGDVPVPADYDGDGAVDYAVYSPRTGTWAVLTSSGKGERHLRLEGRGVPVPADYDGDGAAEPALWDCASHAWVIGGAEGGASAEWWGRCGDIPVPADFDGDGKADVAVWSPEAGIWRINESSTGRYRQIALGRNGDVPLPMDIDGDGKCECVTWRGATQTWSMRRAGGETVEVRSPIFRKSVREELRPAGPGPVCRRDFDGDGREDPLIYSPGAGRWVALLSGGGKMEYAFGGEDEAPLVGDFDGDRTPEPALWDGSERVFRVYSKGGDIFTVPMGERDAVPVPADYTGDGVTDFATFNGEEHLWNLFDPVKRTWSTILFGDAKHTPLPADYDGDGLADAAVWDCKEHLWWVRRSSDGIHSEPWGNCGDLPAPADLDGDGRADLSVWTPQLGLWSAESSSGRGESRFILQPGGTFPYPLDVDGDGRAEPAILDSEKRLLAVRYKDGREERIPIPLSRGGPVQDFAVIGRGEGFVLLFEDGERVTVGTAAPMKRTPVPLEMEPIHAMIPDAGGRPLSLLCGNGELRAERAGAPSAALRWAAADVARDVKPSLEGGGFWMLDAWGRIFGCRDAPPLPRGPLLGGEPDIVKFAVADSEKGYWLLDRFGRVHPVGQVPRLSFYPAFPGIAAARSFAVRPDFRGYYLLVDHGGIMIAGVDTGSVPGGAAIAARARGSAVR